MRILYSKFRAITAMFAIVIVVLCVFGITSTAQAVPELCTWTASSSANMSDSANWASSGGGDCAIEPTDTLIFDGNVTTTDATWDNNSTLIGVASLSTVNNYTGTITLSADASVTSTSMLIGAGATFTNNSSNRLLLRNYGSGLGMLTIASGGTFNGSGGLIIEGDLLNSGTFNQTASSTIMASTTMQTLGALGGSTTIKNLTINNSNTVVLGSDLVLTGTLTVGAGATFDFGTGGLLTSGAIFNSGTITQTASSTILSSTATVTTDGSGATTFYDLTISGIITLAGNVTTTNDLAIELGKSLDLSTYNLNLGGNLANSGTVTHTSGTVTMTGTTKTLGATGGVTTLYNLVVNGTVALGESATTTNDLTIASTKTLTLTGFNLNLGGSLLNSGIVNQLTSGTATMTGSSKDLGGTGSTQFYNLTIDGSITLAGNLAVGATLTTNASKTLNASSKTITLAKASGIPFVLVSGSTFTPGTSEVYYEGTGAITIASTTYASTTLGTGTYTIDGNTTSTGAFSNSGTTIISTGVTLVASGTFDNNGAITETGAIKHALTSSKLTNSSGTEVSSYVTSGGTLYVTVVDTDGNLSTSTANTITGAVVTASDGTSDAEPITLTETGVDTSIFRGSISFTPSAMKTNGNSKLEVNGAGSLSLAFTDSKDSSDTGSDTASYTGSSLGAGGGGGGSVGDITPPSNTSIKIANNATTTAVTGVTLTLGATDASSMMISNDVAFAGASWEEYKTSKTWTLTSLAGTKTVYAKFRDSSSNVSIAVSDTIILEVAGSTTPTTTTTPATTPTTDQTTTPSTPATGATTPATGVTTPSTGTGVQTGTSGTVSTVKFTKELKYLTTNTGVKTLQTELKKMGYFTYPYLTTFYGAATKAAMVKYQKANNIKQTGNLDKATMAVLNGATPVAVEETPSVPTTYTFTKYLAYGYTGTEVKQLQIKLKEMGYLTATPNGTFGPATKAAVIKLQKEYKITPTAGFVGPGTRRVLNGK